MITKRSLELEMTNPDEGINAALHMWLEWTPWTMCSTTCGEGAKLRTRECVTNAVCEGLYYEYMPCHGTPCVQRTLYSQDTKFLTAGMVILINVSMIACILTPFFLKRMKTSNAKRSGKSSPDIGTELKEISSVQPKPIVPLRALPLEKSPPFLTDGEGQKEKANSSAPKPNDDYIIRSQNVTEGVTSSATAGVDSTQQQQQPIPSPRKTADAPDVLRTSSSKTSDSQEPSGSKMDQKAHRSSDSMEEADISSPSLFTSEKTSSETFSKSGLGEAPSFIVPVKRATNKKAKVVDVDVEKLYKYRPQSLDEYDSYQYRPGYNENQHCNVDEYRIESLSEDLDLYRPSAIDDCEGMNYRASTLEKPEDVSIYRASFQEDTSKDNYRMEDMKPETHSYRTSASLGSDLSSADQKGSRGSESIPEIREKPDWKNLMEIQDLIKEIESAERKLIREQLAKERQFPTISDKPSPSISTNDDASPAPTSSNIEFDYRENIPKHESLATRLSSLDLEPKKSQQSEDQKFSLSGKLLELFTRPSIVLRRKRSPSTEPLLKRPSEDSSDIFSQASLSSLLSRIKEQKLQKARYEEFNEFKTYLELPVRKPKKQRQKNVSFAPSSQVKYIIPSSDSQSEESGVSPSSSTSNDMLFKTQIPESPTSPPSPPSEESEESTLFKKSNQQSNNSVIQKLRARKLYEGLVKKIRNRNLNNSTIIPETSEVKHVDVTCSEEENFKRKGCRSEFSDVTGDKPDLSSQSSQEIDSRFISQTSGLMFKSTILEELPADQKENKTKASTIGGPFYKFEKNERRLIEKRRKFLWSSSSSSDQSNFNSNNSKLFNGFSRKFKPLNKNLLR